MAQVGRGKKSKTREMVATSTAHVKGVVNVGVVLSLYYAYHSNLML